MGRSDLLNITQIAAALGVGPASASRFAARGDYGKPVVLKGAQRKLYRLSAVEKANGKPLTAARIDLAKKTHDYDGPNRSALLLKFASLLLDLRDFQWAEHLTKQDVKFTPLPPRNQGSKP